MTDSSQPRPKNRLSRETSPYLLQHRHNPVDWYPWGPEAFAAAKRANKPIFLSVGYSTCYWCHVMERQSFENDAVAAEMNARFINIKVDREERPDVDQLYMTAVQVMTRQGGWPMSVFLTPELRPFYAGTYFPPTDQYGRPGFTRLLRALDEAWKTRRDDVEKSAAELVSVLEKLAVPRPPQSPISFDDELFDEIIQRSVGDFDPKHGGFGDAPKFPRETLLELLLYSQSVSPDDKIGAMLEQTLEALSRGGIRDQLGGGFHRYSTDAKWLVPHFEIMLYDNAMLGFCYAEAYRQTGRPLWASIARGIFDFVLREMTSPGGAFYTALDAEVDSQEGKNYLWTADEIRQLLGEQDAQLFSSAYGVDQGPNFADPHHGSGVVDQNILFLPRPLFQAARLAELSEDALQEKLAPMRATLYAQRAKRKQPLLDTKILTSWNALMIRALAHGGAVLEEPGYIKAAARAADFLLNAHAASDGGLLRSSGGGLEKLAGNDAQEGVPGSTPGLANPNASSASSDQTAPASAVIPGCLDDYAFLAQALLALHRAGHEDKRRTQAQQIAEQMLRRFGDERSGGFFFTDAGAAAELIVRQKVAGDSPLPSGNAIAADVLIDLGRWREARGAIAVFADALTAQAEGMSALVQAAMKFVAAQGPFTVAAGSAAQSADRPQSPEQQAAAIVGVGIAWKNARQLTVSLDIRDGYHINANVADTTTSDGIRLLPTIIAVAEEPSAAIVYPEPVMESVPLAGQEIAIYRETIHVHINLERDIEKGQSLRLTVAYQACSENACLPPVRRQISITPQP